VVVADADAQVKAGQFPVNAAGETAQIDGGTAPSRLYASVSGGQDRSWADILSWGPDRLEIEVESDQPGIVMTHDIYYPGWVAEIDGRPARMLRANLLFRGVEVTEGHHIVVFRFQPFSLANLRRAFVGLFTGHR